MCFMSPAKTKAVFTEMLEVSSIERKPEKQDVAVAEVS